MASEKLQHNVGITVVDFMQEHVSKEEATIILATILIALAPSTNQAIGLIEAIAQNIAEHLGEDFLNTEVPLGYKSNLTH